MKTHPERFILHVSFGAVATCIVIALVLIPSRRDLTHRAFVDGDWKRLQRLSAALTSSELAREPHFFDFLKIYMETRDLPERLNKNKPTPEEKIVAEKVFDAARSYYDKTTEPKEREALLTMMLSWYSFSDRAPVMLDLYRKYASTKSDDAKVQIQLMMLALEVGKKDEALGLVKQISTLSPDLDTRRRLAQELEWHEMPNESFDQYLPLANDGDEPSLLRILSLNEGLFRNRETGNVLAHFIQKTGKSIYDRKLAEIDTLLGDYDEAIDVYKRMLVRSPNDVRFLVSLGQLQKLRLNLDGAVITYEKAALLKPDDAEIQRNLASLTSSLGHFEESFEHLKKVISLDPQSDDLHQFTQLALSLGRRDDAIKGYEQIINLKDTTALDYRFLANLYEQKNRPLDVSRILQEGVQKFPQDSSLRVQLVWNLSDQRKDKDALALLETSSANLNSPDLLQLHLDLLLKNNQLPRALEIVRTQVTGDMAQDREIALLALNVYEQSGSLAEAFRWGQQLYTQYPDDRDITLAYARSLSALGKKEDSLHVLRPLLEQKDAEALRTAAQAATACGRLSEAEIYHSQLVSLPESTRQDWLAYGDLLRSSGKGRLARWAYQQALARES